MTEVGKASIGDDLAGIELISFATSSIDGGVNVVSCTPVKTASETVASDAQPFSCCNMADFIIAILLAK